MPALTAPGWANFAPDRPAYAFPAENRGLRGDHEGAQDSRAAPRRVALERLGQRLWLHQSHRGDPDGTGSHDVSVRNAGYGGGVDYRVNYDTVLGFAIAGGNANWSAPPSQGEAGIAGKATGEVEDLRGEGKPARLQFVLPASEHVGRLADQGLRPHRIHRIDRASAVAAQLRRKSDQQELADAEPGGAARLPSMTAKPPR